METNPLTILCGDALEQLRTLPDESIHCCVTSPPYWGLRDYGTAQWEGGDANCDHKQGRNGSGRADGIVDERGQRNRDGAGAMGGDCGKCGAKRIDSQLGLEKTPEQYVAKMVEVFREVRRVLRKDGTLWLNLGDSYAANEKGSGNRSEYDANYRNSKSHTNRGNEGYRLRVDHGLKPKDLCGIPWRVAFALQADGWWLRSDIIWAKPNPMPESVTDRPTKAHEYLFLLTKSANYFYDAEAIKEGKAYSTLNDDRGNANGHRRFRDYPGAQTNGGTNLGGPDGSRNKRSVWTVATAPYLEAHFATYPPDLIKPCILAGTSAKGCCAKCGSPWERIVEGLGPANPNRHVRSSDVLDVPGDPNYRGGTGHGGLKQAQMGSSWRHETRGWKLNCKCKGGGAAANGDLNSAAIVGASTFNPKDAPIPCTVLDPFAGSGTTGAVALELGRKAVLIELNPKYVELIRQRCNVTMGLALA